MCLYSSLVRFSVSRLERGPSVSSEHQNYPLLFSSVLGLTAPDLPQTGGPAVDSPLWMLISLSMQPAVRAVSSGLMLTR